MMDENMTPEEKEKCAIALDEALAMCGGNDHLFKQIATMMGIRNDALSAVMPLDTKYRGIVNAGPGSGEKANTQWVLARAWQLVVEDGISAMTAIDQAWDELDEKLAPPEKEPEDDLDEFPEGLNK